MVERENNILWEYLINVILLWPTTKTVTANSRVQRPNFELHLSTWCAESVLNFTFCVQFVHIRVFGKVLVASLNLLAREDNSRLKSLTSWFCCGVVLPCCLLYNYSSITLKKLENRWMAWHGEQAIRLAAASRNRHWSSAREAKRCKKQRLDPHY